MGDDRSEVFPLTGDLIHKILFTHPLNTLSAALKNQHYQPSYS